MSLFDRIKNKYLQENKYAKNTPAGDPLSFIAQDQFVRKGRITRRRGAIQQAAVNLGKAVKKQAEIDAASDALNDMKTSGKMGKITPDVSKQMRDIEGDPQSNKIRKEIEKQTGQKTREFTQQTGVTKGNEGTTKYKPPSKAESDAIQTRSLYKKTKRFVNKPGITKSKGSGASTGGQKNLVVNPKSKGTTPVTVSTTKTIKQSDISKKAKKFTAKINKANIERQQTVTRRRASRIKNATGGKKTGSFSKGNLSFPGDRSGAYQATKTDIEFKKSLKKAGGTGDIGFKAPDRKTKVAKRTTRAIKQGTPDPFKIDTSKAAKETAKTFGTKPVKGGLDMGKSTIPTKKPPIKLTKPSDVTPPKSFTDFSKKIKAYREIEKKVNEPSYNIKSKGSGASTGSSNNNYSNTSSRTGGMKGGSGSSSTGGGGYKPPKPPKGGSLGFPNPPEDGNFKGRIPKKPKVTGDAFDNLRNRTKTQFGKIRDTKAFDVRYNRMKNLKSTPKVLRPLKPVGKALVGAAKKNPTTAIALGLGALAYGGYKAFGPKPEIKDTLSKSDFTKVTKTGIVDKKGEQVRRKLFLGTKDPERINNSKKNQNVSHIKKIRDQDFTKNILSGKYKVPTK